MSNFIGFNTGRQQWEQIFHQALSADKTHQTEIVNVREASNQDQRSLEGDGKQQGNRLSETISCGNAKDSKVADETMANEGHFDKRRFQKNDNVNLYITKHDVSHFTEVCPKKTTDMYNQKFVFEPLEEFDRLRVRDLSSQKRFPSEEICPHLSLRANYEDAERDDEITCQTNPLNESECEFVAKYVGKPREFSAKPCFEDITTQTKPLCWFRKDYRTNSEDIAGLECNTLPCRPNPVYLGVFNISIGQVLPDDQWPGFNVDKDLEKVIGYTMTMKDANHFRY